MKVTTTIHPWDGQTDGRPSLTELMERAMKMLGEGQSPVYVPIPKSLLRRCEAEGIDPTEVLKLYGLKVPPEPTP